MANKHRGYVEFEDSEGHKYVLRMGLNQYISVKKALAGLETDEWLRMYFHTALVHGDESQKEITLEQAGEIIDDIGMKKADDLIKETKYHKDSVEAMEIERKRREEAQLEASKTFAQKIATLRKGVTDPVVLQTIDDVIAKIDEISKAGSANPPEAAMSSIS